MGQPVLPPPAKCIVGMLAADVALFAAAEAAIAERLGAIDYASEVLPFIYSSYYDAELGTPLLRRFVSLARLVDQADLPTTKLTTNAIEQALAVGGRRRVNLDPGYVTRTKVVLATTKDYSHRLYIGMGIYAEVTLNYRNGEYVASPWTYPDYASAEYRHILGDIRRRYLQQLAAERRP